MADCICSALIEIPVPNRSFSWDHTGYRGGRESRDRKRNEGGGLESSDRLKLDSVSPEVFFMGAKKTGIMQFSGALKISAS